MGERATYDSEPYRTTQFPAELGELLATEFSDRFVDAMRNRMIVSFYKYGKVAINCPERTDSLASLEKRIAKYRETGNAEWLVDVANFAMIEFMHPKHADAHFRGTDSAESPGLVKIDGSTVHTYAIPEDGSLSRLKSMLHRDGD